MQAYLLVFLGGGLGSIFRFGIAQAMARYTGIFPMATLVANALSCIILGALVAYSFKGQLAPSGQFFLMVGFCGGFSTFSTFSNETYHLLTSGQTSLAFANILFSVLLCLGCIFLGLKMVN